MAIKYQQIYGERDPRDPKHFLRGTLLGLFIFAGAVVPEFKPKESNEIIRDIVRRIEEYEQKRGMETSFSYAESEDCYPPVENNRITKAEMRSKDEVVQGVIYYRKMEFGIMSGDPLGPDSVALEFNFNSDNESDKQEYDGLARIIKGN